MIVIVYRWRLKDGREAAFRSAWETVTKAYRERGSGGSALFEAEDGAMVGIARWPNLALRDRLFAENLTPEAFSAMRECIEKTLPPMELREMLNLWAYDEAPLTEEAAS